MRLDRLQLFYERFTIASRDTRNHISEEDNRWQSALNEHGHQARQTSDKLLVWLRLNLDLNLAKRALQCNSS